MVPFIPVLYAHSYVLVTVRCLFWHILDLSGRETERCNAAVPILMNGACDRGVCVCKCALFEHKECPQSAQSS